MVCMNLYARTFRKLPILIIFIAIGAIGLVFITSFFLGSKNNSSIGNNPTIIYNQEKIEIKEKPLLCPENLSSCQQITIGRGESFTLVNVDEAVVTSTLIGSGVGSVKRVNNGWNFSLPNDISKFLTSSGDLVWVVNVI